MLQALERLEHEDHLIRKQSLQLGRLIIDFNAERGNNIVTLLCHDDIYVVQNSHFAVILLENELYLHVKIKL